MCARLGRGGPGQDICGHAVTEDLGPFLCTTVDAAVCLGPGGEEPWRYGLSPPATRGVNDRWVMREFDGVRA